MIVHRKTLRPISVRGGQVQRSLVTVGKQPVVLFHKKHAILQKRFSAPQWRQFATRTPLGADVDAELGRWNEHSANAFNCHTLAIGAPLGMAADCWLEGSSSIFTLQENPAQTLLDAFFEELVTGAAVEDVLEQAQDDDVLVFGNRRSGDLVHSGLIRIREQQVCLLSKLGEYPVAITTTDAIAAEYAGQFDYVQRLRSSSSVSSARPTLPLRPNADK